MAEELLAHGEPIEAAPWPDPATIPATCGTCNRPLDGYSYGQTKLPGLYCSEWCLNEAARSAAEA